MFDYCFRCGDYTRVFVVGDHRYCRPCAELGLSDRPDYRKTDRRNPEHPPRGYGRRFRDSIKRPPVS